MRLQGLALQLSFYQDGVDQEQLLLKLFFTSFGLLADYFLPPHDDCAPLPILCEKCHFLDDVVAVALVQPLLYANKILRLTVLEVTEALLTSIRIFT